MKIARKDCESKQKINTENYLTEKKIKREYRRNRYQNMSEESQLRLKEYQKKLS